MRRSLFMIACFFFLSCLAISIELKGKILHNRTQIGQQGIFFVDASNEAYYTKSDAFGEYEIELASGSYRVFLEGDFYQLEEAEKIYSFQKDEIRNWNVKLFPKIVEGIVIDEEGYPVPKAEVIVRTSEGSKEYEANDWGAFQIPIAEDFFTIFARKEGFSIGGEVIFMQGEKAPKNIQVRLRKQFSHIRGIISDGVKALSGVTVRLRNQDWDIVEETFSDSLGYYRFPRVEQNRLLALSVYEDGFEEYRSDFFVMDGRERKQHIILHSIK